MMGFRKSTLLGASTVALAVALSGGVQAAVIQLPVVDPNFLYFSGTAPKALVSDVKLTYWSLGTITHRPQGDLSGIDAPGTAQQFGVAPGCAFNSNPTCQPYGVYTGLGNPPTGGNFLQMDGNQVFGGFLYQKITGLVVGQEYQLGFWQAAGQQNGTSFTLATQEHWLIYFGNPIGVDCTGISNGPCNVTTDSNSIPGYNASVTTALWTTPTMNTPAKGYVDWNYVQNTDAGGTVFKATATEEYLTYFAWGINAGGSPQSVNQPPTVFLAGFNNVQAPEPATLSVIGVGLAGLAATRRRWTRLQRRR